MDITINANQRGYRAEKIALHYLKRHGLVLVDKNYATRCGEIDLIMLDKKETNILTFIEVRLRSASNTNTALNSVDCNKQRKIIRTAKLFLQKKTQYRFYRCRFDIIALCPKHQKTANFLSKLLYTFNLDSEKNYSIHWLKHAFTA